MKLQLTSRQSNELGRFFMDLAKGIAIGVFGFATFSGSPLWLIFLYLIFTGVVVSWCVKMGLGYLR